MASDTPILGLHKKDPVTDGHQTFNIKTMLNDNWDKLDTFAQLLLERLENIDGVDEVVSQILDDIGNMSDLPTENKLSLVTAINEIYQAIVLHKADDANPHNVTKAQVGLGNVDNVKQIPYSEKGQPNGVAVLDENGKIVDSEGNEVGLTEVSGSYSGDGTSDRLIAIGFKPKFIVINNNAQFYILFNNNAMRSFIPGQTNIGNHTITITDEGFIVPQSLNSQSNTFVYRVLG